MTDSRLSRRRFVRGIGAATGVAGLGGLGGCASLRELGLGGGGDTAVMPWLHFRETDHSRWGIWSFDRATYRSEAPALNDTYWTYNHRVYSDLWYRTGITAEDVDVSTFYWFDASTGVRVTLGSFGAETVRKHVEWLGYAPDGSHDGFDVFVKGPETSGVGQDFSVGADVLGLVDGTLVQVVDFSEGGGPETARSALETVIDDRDTSPEPTASDGTRLVDAVGFGLETLFTSYEGDDSTSLKPPGPAALGARRVDVAGENRFDLTYRFRYEEAGDASREATAEWIAERRESPVHAFDTDTDVETTVEGRAVEVSARVTGMPVRRYP